MEKTYKIGEYAVGGIVEINYTNDTYSIKFKDWYTGKVVTEAIGVDRVTALNFLEEHTTIYYADIIINFKPFKNKK